MRILSASCGCLRKHAPRNSKFDRRASYNFSFLSDKEVVIFNVRDTVTEFSCDP